MPMAFISRGKVLSPLPFKRCKAAIILGAPTNLAAPASARYSGASAAEPHHNKAGQEAKQHLQHHAHHKVSHRAALFFIAVARHHIGNQARQEHHKRVHHTLNQGQSHHVTIGHVRHFMCQHCLHFFARHAMQQTCAHRHQ